MEKFELLMNSMGLESIYMKLILGFLCSFGITFFSIPVIIRVSHRKNLMDEPGIRSSHTRKIPNLGGIALFFSIAVCAPIFSYQLFDSYKFLFASLIILFFVGILDDILVMRALKKLIAQIIVSIFIVVGSDVRISNLFGVFGVHELNYYVSVFVSICVFVILINAYNLIDGIDGLAGGYAILCCLFFGISYYRLGHYNYPLVVLCSIIIGAITALLRFNLSKGNKKIFMGDTGSMIIGFLLAFTSMIFISIFIDNGIPSKPHYHLKSAPVIAVSILILPIIDTLNVIIIRLINKKSPFSADKNHIHHRLLNLGFTHRKSSALILSFYLIIVITSYFLRHINENLLLLIIIAMGFIFSYFPLFISNKNTHAAK